MNEQEQLMEALEHVLDYAWHDEVHHFYECHGKILEDLEWDYRWDWEDDCDPLPKDLESEGGHHIFESLLVIREWLLAQPCEA